MAVNSGVFPWVAVVSLLAGGALFALVWYLDRHRGKAGATWFMASLSAQGGWCLSYGIALLVPDSVWREALEMLSWVCLSWVGFLFLGFALDYTGRSDIRQSNVYTGLGIVPTLGSLLVLTAPYHDLFWSDPRTVRTLGVVGLDYTWQLGAYAVLLVGLSFAGIGVFLLAEAIVNYGPLYRSEALAVGISTVPPSIGLFAWMLNLGPAHVINWGVALSLPHAALDAYAFVGKNMFETNPTTRRTADESAIESLSDPVVIVDADCRIVDFNDAAGDTFAVLTDESLGSFLRDMLDIDIDPTTDSHSQYLTVTGGDRVYEFNIQSNPLTDPREEVVGYTLLFQDITVEREREQRLTVLNRVLRHNLLNKLTAIGGYASQLERRVEDEELSEFAGKIVQSRDELAAMSRKARDFDQLRESDLVYEETDISELLGELVSEFEETYPGAAFRTELNADGTISTAPELLRLALENVIENAVEHTRDGPPEVLITVDDVPGESVLGISISDNGPGIPDGEVATIQQGDEEQLDHGSGIGLWIVNWSVSVLGGEVTFESDEAGTTVTLRVPKTGGS